MKTSWLVSFIGSVCLGGLGYFVTGYWYFFLGIFSFCLAISIYLICPLYEKCFQRRRKTHECFKFINSFVISTSVTNSLLKAYDASIEGSNGEMLEVINEFAPLEIIPRIKSLSFYFDQDVYLMFLGVLDVYVDQGGNMLELSRDLLLESSRIEESSCLLEKSSSRHMFNYVVLNVMSLAILAFMRFGLTTFYKRISNSVLYLLSIAFYFAFIIVSFLVYSSSFTGEKIVFPKIGKK